MINQRLISKKKRNASLEFSEVIFTLKKVKSQWFSMTLGQHRAACYFPSRDLEWRDLMIEETLDGGVC